MTHKQKVKVARRLRGFKKENLRIPIFQTEEWETQKTYKALRVRRQQKEAHERAVTRKQLRQGKEKGVLNVK